MSNLNMPVKYCKDENDEEFSPVVYQESMFNDDGTRMDPVPRKMFAKAYDPTKTYPTENLFCIQDNKYYKFTGSGTTTGTFDPTKWTETDDATELTALNSTLNKTPTLVQKNSTYVDFSAVYVLRIGNLVNVSGRFEVITQKPAGQENYLFSGLHVPKGIVATVSCSDKTVTLLVNNIGHLTSNSAVGTGYYNIDVTYSAI